MWHAHQDLPLADWRYEVADGYTGTSYIGWVNGKLEGRKQSQNDSIRIFHCRYLRPALRVSHCEAVRRRQAEAIRKLDLVNFREELADIVIRVASMASGLGVDLDAEISDKLDHNRTRGYRHGGKAI